MLVKPGQTCGNTIFIELHFPSLYSLMAVSDKANNEGWLCLFKLFALIHMLIVLSENYFRKLKADPIICIFKICLHIVHIVHI